MATKGIWLTSLFLLASWSLCVPPGRAEEDPANEAARELVAPAPVQAGRAPWQASVEGGWLPRADSTDAGGKVGLSEAKVRIGRSYRITARLNLTPEFSYSLLSVDAPGGARLPDELHTLSLGLRGDYRVSPRFSWSALAAPGLAGDFRRIGGSDIRARFGFTGRYQSSEKLTLLAGLIYQQGYRSLPVFPIIGAIYRPDDRWTISLAAPRPGVSYAWDKELRVYAGAEMFGGEYRLHDPALGARVVRYRDFRLAGGAEFPIVAGLKGDLAAGWAFGREFVFYDVTDPARWDIKVDAGPFVRGGLKMEW